jgi:uncharacterized coiled-coil protein SlyX
MNYVLNLANYIKLRHLQCVIEEDQNRILELESALVFQSNLVNSLKATVSMLEREVESQNNLTQRLQDSLNSHQNLLKITMEKVNTESRSSRKVISSLN